MMDKLLCGLNTGIFMLVVFWHNAMVMLKCVG